MTWRGRVSRLAGRVMEYGLAWGSTGALILVLLLVAWLAVTHLAWGW